ncbi:MAG: kelch repeat-containing protein [bacterium]|nr:kelch repeat-containing protein [bacterium]
MRTPYIVLAALLTAPALLAQNWGEVNPFFGKPSPRRAGAMAYDPVGDRAVMNGGTIASPGQILNETWVFDDASKAQGNNNWIELTATGPARWGHRMVADLAGNRLITFGGRSPTISGLANDTWEFVNDAWAPLTPPTSPPPRFGYGMVYDSARDLVVLFGGRVALGDTNDTWEFNGITWTEAMPATQPPPREDMVMVYDRAVGTTVLFGGLDAGTNMLLGDTWEYNGIDWREVTPVTSPSPRYRSAAVYDTQRQRIVLYGGWDGAFKTDTFEYSGAAWDAIAVSPGSTNSTEQYACYDSQRGVFRTFGGVGTVFSDDQYDYTGITNGVFGPFGMGCPHSAGTATITAAAPPTIGQSLDMQVIDVPDLGPTQVTLIVNGFSSTLANVGALPFDLSGFGLTGCFLEVRDDGVLVIGKDGNGDFTFGFNVPNNTALVNLNYYVQAYVPDPNTPNGLGGVSRPSRATFGN